MKTDLELKQDVQSELLWDPLVVTAAVEHALNWNTSVPQDRVKALVEKAG